MTIQAPVIAMADLDRLFYLCCDTSNLMIGYVEMQYDAEMEQRGFMISFVSAPTG